MDIMLGRSTNVYNFVLLWTCLTFIPIQFRSQVYVGFLSIPFFALLFQQTIRPIRPFVVPWDVAHQFDLILPALPTNLGQTMLVMGGHLMFFRHEKRVMVEFFNFHALRSLQTFLDAPDRWIDPGAGEHISSG